MKLYKLAFITALQKGKIVSNPVFWKKFQNLINLIFGLSGVIGLMYPEIAALLSPDNLVAITIGITSINSYLSTITSDKVGV